MTPATAFRGRRVALFGLGGSGMATALALRDGGAEVLAWDDTPARVEAAAGQGVPTGDLALADWARFDAFVLSPGVPLTHPEPHWTVRLARAAGVAIIGDVEVFCRERALIAPRAPFVAITGTNGKSTTTALIAHILRQAGRDVQMGGNIGTPILALEPPAGDRVHVVELSSFQIDLTPSLAPSVGVLLNITPDHLDRHGTMEAYAAIKERLVAEARLAVVGVDDEPSRTIAGRLAPAGRVTVTVEPGAAATLSAPDGRLVEQGEGEPMEVADIRALPTLRGRHNWQNAAVAYAVAREVGVDPRTILAALRTFPGLAHRMEQVGRIGRALVVNDSKATNADSADKALGAFPAGIHWIAGGKAKAGGIAPLKPLFTRIEKAYLVGEAMDAFAATLDGLVPFERCGTLDRAVTAAAAGAAASGASEPVLLLSPACASYDQFRSFEERGDRFRELVQALPGFERL